MAHELAGSADDSAETILPSTPAATPPRRRVLAVLSALMGFASISTDLYLPAMPTMGRDLGADAGSIELTVSGFLIGFSLGQLFWSETDTAVGCPSRSALSCSSSARPAAPFRTRPVK